MSAVVRPFSWSRIRSRSSARNLCSSSLPVITRASVPISSRINAAIASASSRESTTPTGAHTPGRRTGPRRRHRRTITTRSLLPRIVPPSSHSAQTAPVSRVGRAPTQSPTRRCTEPYPPLLSETNGYHSERRQPGGRAQWAQNLACMYTLGLDTIAGAKLLHVKFGSAGVFEPDRSVMHGDRRARFIRMHKGAAVIRHSDDSHPVAVPPDSLSIPSANTNYSPLSTPAVADARLTAGATPDQAGLIRQAETGRPPHRHPQRRPLVRP
jgi:hypothetical protein